ncbi:MAG TPA: SRPBCC family protein [Blastocatellia bacterium]|nr:SRPBCC family protein [Blastocatellia bacterium]
MQVKVEKSFKVKHDIEDVWALLSDPAKVVTCVPGAKLTEKVDETHYKGTISVKVGPTLSDFKGEAVIEEMDAQAHRMALTGKGQDVKGKGSASMKMTGELRAVPEGGTEVITVSEVSIVGLLAQFGGRMVNDISNKIFDEFTKSFQQQLDRSVAEKRQVSAAGGTIGEPSAEGAATAAPGAPEPGQPGPSPSAPAAPVVPQEPEPIKAIPLILSALVAAIKRFFRRLFGGGAESA